MKTAKEIQLFILETSGIKTSTRKGTGSMKGYFIIWPIYQNNAYPNIPIAVVQQLKEQLKEYDFSEKPLLCTCSDISVYGLIDEREAMKKERKQTQVSDKPTKGWGSKNSQLRLDKATARNAKKLKNGGVARYY